MKISRNRLRDIIRESISKVLLNEYRGEQLMLPFDGNSVSLNYEQYIDFVKCVTKPGELTSNIRNIDDYYEHVNVSDELLFDIGMNCKFYNGYVRDEFSDEEYKIVLSDLERQYGEGIYGENSHPWSNRYNIGEELSDEGFRCLANYLIYIGKIDIKHMLNDLLKNSNGNGMVYINRVLTIPKALSRYTEDGYDCLYDLLHKIYGDLGDYWAYGINTGGAYNRNNFDGGNSTIRLIGMTPIENIDMAETCGVESVGEYEVYFYDDRKIMIVGLEIDDKKIDIGHRVLK